MKKLIAVALLSLSFAFVGVGCTTDNGGNGGDGGTQQPNNKKNVISEEMAKKIDAAQKKFVTNYAKLALAGYEDSLEGAKELKKAIDALVEETAKDTPDSATAEDLFKKAKEAWVKSREPYLQTEIFRFYDGPINMNVKYEGGKFVKAEDGGDELEPLINAWPLDEGYIDYVVKDTDPTAIDDEAFSKSIIGDKAIKLTKDGLIELNEKGDEANVSVGYHAIEFMLWGQDLFDDTAGQRKVTDYIGTTDDEKKIAKRRRDYIAIVADILVDHLTFIVDQWKDGVSDNYRAEFVKSPKESTVKATNALRLLAGFETGGERIAQALDSKKQEDEHSCFSDNTHRDMIQDVQGMLNVYNGTYTKVDGTKVGDAAQGLKSVFTARDEKLATAIGKDLEEAKTAAVAAEKLGRFDQLIKAPETDPGNKELFKIFGALNQKAEGSIFKIQDLLNYEIECEQDEVDGKPSENNPGSFIHAKKEECQKKN